MSFLQKEHELWPAEERVELISRTELNVQLINAQLAQISIQLDSVATSAHVATLVANMRSATTRLELHRSLKLRFKFDKNCAIFAPALFRAACSAPDATLALAAARLLTMVLKFVLSSSAGISKLRPFRLPWPTLLDRLRALAEPRLATAGIDGVEGRLFVSLFVLAKVARRFFFDDELASPDSSRALVARLESQLACGLGDSSAFDAQVMLLAFTSVRSAVPLDPQLVPLVFRYWPTVVDVPEWDARWMWLLARCSRAHSNSLQWSDTQVATICNVALQWLDVMLAGATERFKRHEQRGLGGALNWLQPESTGVSFAKWFASAVTPRTDALVDGVARLLTTVDGYTHPANGGRHASRASLLMVEIARQLARRCVRERTEAASVAAAAAAAADEDEAIEDDENEGGGDADVDDEDDDDKDARVDDDDDVRTLSHIAPERRLLSSANASLSPFEQSPVVRRLVPLLLSMASKALYSRGQREQQHAVNTIRALAFLAPDFVLPQVYERALVALSSDTDAHQTPVSFNVVSHTLIDACTLLGVSKLRRFLPAFAELSLVALGANDMPRTRSALQFALVLLSAVPLAAVPSSATDDEAEDAREVLEQLIGYPEQLLRRILDLLSHAETARPSSDTDATSDSASASGERHELHTSIVAVVETALQQFAGDAAQRTECIELILRTVPTLVPHGATATYAAVFGAAVRAQATPSAVIKALLARFGAALDGWSAESTQLPLPAPALVHALQLLATTASQLRDAVPTHWAALQKIAERGMAVDQPIAVTRAAVSLMHALYATALTTTVAECRSLQSADELREHWRHWGKRYRFKEVQIEWVRTGDEARQAAIAAARAVLADAQEQLSKPLTQLGVRALIRRLQALISGWSGPTALVGQNDSVVDANASGGVEYFSLRYVGTDGADAVVAARTELAQSAALLVSKLLAELTAQLPDDTVAMLRALTCAQDLLSRFGSVNVSQFPLAVARSVVKDPLGPRWTRGTIVAIVARHRHKHRATLGCGTGSVTAQLLASVGEVCSSLYSEVRKSAQVALYEAASLRPSAARPLVEPLFEQLRLNQDRADSPAAEKMRTALVTGTLHKLSLLAVVHDAIPFPATRLRLLTFVCTDGARYDRLQSQARLSSLFVQLLSPHDPVTHPRPSADELGVAIDTCLRVAQSGESHWRYRVYASVVLLQYALPRAGAVGGAVDDERLTRVVAHFADCAVGSLRPLRLIGRMVTTRLLAGVQRIASNGADLVDVSDDEVRAFAARIGAGGDVGDDADDSALYFDDAPWVGRVLVDASALADGRKFARGAAHAVAREQLPPAVRELERRFTDAQFVGKLCDMAALDRVVNEDERAALMSAFARGMGGGMGGDDDTATDHVERVVSAVLSMAIEFSSRSGMTSKSKSSGFDKAFARLAYGASRSFGWQRCGTLLLACAERLIPLVTEKGGQLVAVELFAGLARASRRWPSAERVPARALLGEFLRRHCVLGGYLDGSAELQTAVRFVVNRADPRRVAWLEAALRVEWLVDVAHAPDVGNASAQARALELTHVLVEALDWRGAALCARLVDVLQRGVANQSVTRFSQVRLATGALIGAIVCATRGVPASPAMRALIDALIGGAPTRPETLELLLQVALFDTAITDVLGEALPRLVPIVLDGQRATDRDRAAMASLASVSLMQDTLSPAQLDALVAAFGALGNSTSADAESAWQSRRLALPMLQLVAFRHRFVSTTVTASALAIGKRALVDPRVEVREVAELLIASVLRGQAASVDMGKLRVEYAALARGKSADEQHGGVLGLAAMMASEPYNMPTWLLDVAQALVQHASSKSRLCRETAQRAAREFFQTRGRALEELGVTPSGNESAEQLQAANERLEKVSASLRDLSATHSHYA